MCESAQVMKPFQNKAMDFYTSPCVCVLRYFQTWTEVWQFMKFPEGDVCEKTNVQVFCSRYFFFRTFRECSGHFPFGVNVSDPNNLRLPSSYVKMQTVQIWKGFRCVFLHLPATFSPLWEVWVIGDVTPTGGFLPFLNTFPWPRVWGFFSSPLPPSGPSPCGGLVFFHLLADSDLRLPVL